MLPRLTWLVLPLLSACHSDSAESPFAPRVSNLALAGAQVRGSGLLRVVAASEASEGRDLDADGDFVDDVVHLLDLRRGTLTNTGLALPAPAVGLSSANLASTDALAVFAVDEGASGRDVDQDDVLDEVETWIYNRRTQALSAQGFLHTFALLEGDLAVLLTQSPTVQVHVYDARDESLVTLPVEQSEVLGLHRDFLAFALSEDGVTDLNGDGDALDARVLHLYDAELRHITNTGWAVRQVQWVGDFLGFHVFEADQGRDDLDGRPGVGFAFVALNPRTGETRVPLLASTGFAEVLGPTGLFHLDQHEGLLGTDENGDGDAEDIVQVFYEPRHERTLEPALARGGPSLEAWPWIGLVVDELRQGEDLDGDGELASSSVLHLLHALDGRLENRGLDGQWFGAFGIHLLATRRETTADWNRDGDRDDRTLFHLDTQRMEWRGVGVAPASFDGNFFEQALLTVPEFANGFDGNDDGDREDLLLSVYHAGTLRWTPLPLSLGGRPDAPAQGITAFLTPETTQGGDLNGDGDMLDLVLHSVRLVQRID